MSLGFLFTDDLFTHVVGKGPGTKTSQFDKLLTEFESHFTGEEDKGPELTTGLANIVNASLRRRPHEDHIKKLLTKQLIPNNVPNLQVPMTNTDVRKALARGPNIVDIAIRKSQLAISRAMVPVLTWLHDFGTGETYSYYLQVKGIKMLMMLNKQKFLCLCRDIKRASRLPRKF